MSNKPRDLDLMVLDIPKEGKGVQLEIRGDRKTVVDWLNGKARQRSVGGAVEQGRQLMQESGPLDGTHLP